MTTRFPADARTGRFTGLIWASIFAVAVAGVWLLVVGLTPVPQAAPLPAPFVVSPSPLQPEVVPPMAANRLVISQIGVDAPLLPGEVNNNTLDIPSDPAELTLFSDGGQPCAEKGSVLVAGHVAVKGVKGALWTLSQIEPNMVARLSCADGTVTAWQAVRVQVELKANLPAGLGNPAADRRLVVVTCGGPVMADGNYRDNVIVYFEPTD